MLATAFLFPGQGAQSPGMLHRLPDHQVVKATIAEASSVLRTDALELDTAAALDSTVNIQLALLISGVAMARVLMHESESPAYVAGHSVGAFGAAVVSEAVSLRDALGLVQLRARMMEQAFPSGYGMGVISGCSPSQIRQLADEARSRGEQVFAANYNAAQQVVITGKLEGIGQVLRAAQNRGARQAKLLKVPVPSHCPLLEPVARRLEDALSRIPVSAPKIPCTANTTARLLQTADGIRNDLAYSVASPVMWHDAVTQLYERGTRLFIEMPPGQVLTSLAKQSCSSACSVASDGVRLDTLLYLIRREQA